MDEVTMEEQIDINENHGEYIGYVKWFNKKKGYGFITITDGGHQGEDVFCHSVISQLKIIKLFTQVNLYPVM